MYPVGLPMCGPDTGVPDDPTRSLLRQKEFKSDEFRMFQLKIMPCKNAFPHSHNDCPFSHPEEKARRRDPMRYLYDAVACPHFRKGLCPFGVDCLHAHGVFELWLHPAKYKTALCTHEREPGQECDHPTCFFAHTGDELRAPPPAPPASPLGPPYLSPPPSRQASPPEFDNLLSNSQDGLPGTQAASYQASWGSSAGRGNASSFLEPDAFAGAPSVLQRLQNQMSWAASLPASRQGSAELFRSSWAARQRSASLANHRNVSFPSMEELSAALLSRDLLQPHPREMGSLMRAPSLGALTGSKLLGMRQGSLGELNTLAFQPLPNSFPAQELQQGQRAMTFDAALSRQVLRPLTRPPVGSPGMNDAGSFPHGLWQQPQPPPPRQAPAWMPPINAESRFTRPPALDPSPADVLYESWRSVDGEAVAQANLKILRADEARYAASGSYQNGRLAASSYPPGPASYHVEDLAMGSYGPTSGACLNVGHLGGGASFPSASASALSGFSFPLTTAARLNGGGVGGGTPSFPPASTAYLSEGLLNALPSLGGGQVGGGANYSAASSLLADDHAGGSFPQPSTLMENGSHSYGGSSFQAAGSGSLASDPGGLLGALPGMTLDRDESDPSNLLQDLLDKTDPTFSAYHRHIMGRR